jgi:hypothetical protein
MEVLENGTPVTRRLSQKLKSKTTPEQIRREFMTVMTKAYAEYALVMYKRTKTGVEVRTINANLYSAKNMIMENWRQAQKHSPIIRKSAAGTYVANMKVIEDLAAEYDTLKALGESWSQSKGAAARSLLNQYNQKGRELVRKMLEANGIVFTEEMYKELFKQYPNMKQEWAENANGEPNGIFSIFMGKMKNMKDEDDGVETSLEINNPLYGENTTLKVLASTYAKHATVLYNSSHRDLAGNTIWDYTLNSFLGKAFNELTSEDKTYRNILKQTHFARNNWLLKKIDEQEGVRTKMKLMYLEGMKKMGGKAAAERSEMSDRDQLFMALAMFMNSGFAKAHFVSLTHSDKTTTPVLMNVPRTQTMQGGKYAKDLMDRLMDVFESEFDRIAGTEDHVFAEQQFQAGKGHFFLLPLFNYNEMSKLVTAGIITAEDMAQVWIAPGKINRDLKGLEDTQRAVKKILRHFIHTEAVLQYNKIINTGIVDPAAGKHLLDPKYIKRVSGNRKIRADKKGYYDDAFRTQEGIVTKGLTQEQYLHELAYAVALDYAMNSFLVNTSIAQLMTGDPAEVWKKDVKTTLIEYQKRLAGPLAPGKETEWKEALRMYNTVILDDVTVALDYIKSEGIRKKYMDVNITDAQEFVTVQEHLDVMFHYGLISEETYEEMSAVIVPGGDYRFNDEQMKVIMQITKPVYFGKRPSHDRGVLLHDYVKSSAMPLYPGFTANTDR